MTDVRIDLAAVRDAAARLRRLGADLEGSAAVQSAIVEAAGHERLRDALARFADGWRVSRADLSDRLAALHQRATAIAETFDELDRALGDGLEATTDARREGAGT